MGEPTELAFPLVNVLVQELLQDHGSYFKVDLLVKEDFNIWATVIPSLGIKFFKYTPLQGSVSYFRKFVQGGNLS